MLQRSSPTIHLVPHACAVIGQEQFRKFRISALILEKREYIVAEERQVFWSSTTHEYCLHPIMYVAMVCQDMWQKEPPHDYNGNLELLSIIVELLNEAIFKKQTKGV